MKHKLFAIVISLALIVTMVLPGTLAIAADQDSSTGETAPTVEIPVTEEKPVENTGAAPVVAPAECSCGTETEVHCQGCPLYIAAVPTDPVKACTCGTEDDIHTEGCPLYVKAEEVPSVTVGTPSDAEKPGVTTGSPECTCDPKPAEGEAHKEGCPLYIAPEKPAAPSHIDTCSDDCTDAECKCPCHLFNKIMACTTLDDIWAAFDEASDETVNALTDEQNAQIDAKIEALEPAPAPAVVIEESTEETVPSEIVYRTVNYTYVAPFGDPVTGGHR